MVCKITFGKLCGRPGPVVPTTAGATLVEILIGLGIGTLLTLALVSMSMFSGRSMASLLNYVDLDHSNQVALDRLTREIRQTSYLQSFQTNKLVFAEGDGVPLSFEYSPADRTLIRTKGPDSAVLLRDCDRLQFTIYQRNPSNAVYNFFPATVTTNCKLVEISWTCSRTILGKRVNSEEVQSARIALRAK